MINTTKIYTGKNKYVLVLFLPIYIPNPNRYVDVTCGVVLNIHMLDVIKHVTFKKKNI